jgi:hypothetical protein
VSIYIWIRRADLVAAGACSDGLAEFDRLAREQGRRTKLRLRWDALGSAWAWAAYPHWCAWLARRNLIPASMAGNHGTARAGENGHAIAGDYGAATVGDHGHAIAGDYGHATAGDYGAAIAGANGTATVGAGGTASAGPGGTVRIAWWCSATKRIRWVTGYVGEGIEANVLYVVRDGRLVRKVGAT